MLAPLFGFSGFPLVYRMWELQPSKTALRSTRARVGIVVYREYSPPTDLVGVVSCVWEQIPAEPHSQHVVPDGCLDLIWLSDRELVVAGADTAPRLADLPPDVCTSGIRITPGAGGAVFGVPADELRDRQVDAHALWGAAADRLAAALAEASRADRLALLAGAVAAREPRPDHLVVAVAQRLSTAESRVATVAADLGVSERHLHRRVVAAVGYGPKMLARVARLRRLRALSGPLADRALAAGYASQAHMTEEVRRLTGRSPVRFLKDLA